MTEVEAVIAHHAGEHIPQPCCVQYADGSWSPCDVQTLTTPRHAPVAFRLVSREDAEDFGIEPGPNVAIL